MNAYSRFSHYYSEGIKKHPVHSRTLNHTSHFECNLYNKKLHICIVYNIWTKTTILIFYSECAVLKFC